MNENFESSNDCCGEEYNQNGKKRFRLKSKFSKILVNLLITFVIGFVYFYIKIPAVNLHSEDFYVFVFILCIVYSFCAIVTSGINVTGGARGYLSFVKAQCKFPFAIVIILAVIFALGAVSSLVIFRSGAYRDLLPIKEGNFAEDVEEISYNKIPMLDKESAEKLGDRKLGELSDMVSQFEVSAEYTQINLNERPVRVTPLAYGDVIKWFNNRGKGLPAYMIIDMATQAVEVVRLNEGMKYSPSEIFNRNIYRHLRFNYPTFMFDTPTFEIDDNKNPYWVCPKLEKTIGLFGGTDIKGAVLVNAVTGECKYYEEVPTWVDRVYTAELIIQQYDYYGLYQGGFLNSIFGQKGVTVTTDGYNYIALDDDVYVYTGITSVGGDQSNIGFILSNQRTKETKFYRASGAAEYSAMSSAEGVVQDLGYKATFPLLLNISSQPTYFMSLKDNVQLVKKYAMVNVQQYQIVATGTSVAACEQEYIRLLAQNNIIKEAVPVEAQVSGGIAEIRTAVKDGNSYYYIRLKDESRFYVISAAANELAVVLNVGDFVTIEYDMGATGDICIAYSVTRGGEKPKQPPMQPSSAEKTSSFSQSQ